MTPLAVCGAPSPNDDAAQPTQSGFTPNSCSIHAPTWRVVRGKVSVMVIKSITAREIFCLCPHVKKQLWGGEFWSDGYFASSVGRHGDENTIKDYVKGQGQEYQKIHEDRQLALF